MSYSIKPETTRDDLIRRSVFEIEDQFGNLIINPDTLTPTKLDVSIPSQRADVFLRKRLDVSYRYIFSSNVLGLNLELAEREFQNLGRI